MFCHRLIRKTGKFCILKGDTLLAADPPIAWEQIIGRVSTLIDSEARLLPLDTSRQRRIARQRARLTYPLAFLFHVGRIVHRCLIWTRGIRLPEDR